MRVAPGESCEQSVYGPYEQTLFLGCSIIDFSVSAGWNQQTSELTVNLVEDPCDTVKKRYWTSPNGGYIIDDFYRKMRDPGFTYPNIGAPAFFKVADFEFSGIIQSYTTTEGPDGNPKFTVKLVDPRVILDQCQVILDSYEGSVQGIYNLFNVYAFLEHFESVIKADRSHPVNETCDLTETEGTRFASPVGFFGGSRKTSRGIPWTLIRKALIGLTGNKEPLMAIPDGAVANAVNTDPNRITYYSRGIVGRGGSGYGYGELTDSNHPIGNDSTGGKVKYLLDLSELPDVDSLEYRIAGPVVSLSDLINQVCADAGVDYFVDLLPTKIQQEGNYFPHLIIKIRTISRRNQTVIGQGGVTSQFGGNASTVNSQINQFIQSHSYKENDSTRKGIISDSYGRELRTAVNTSFLIGGAARQYFQENPDENTTVDGEVVGPSMNMTPFWGWDGDGNLIQSAYKSGVTQSWRVLLDFRKINLALKTPVGLNDGLRDKPAVGAGQQGLVYETRCEACFGWVTENELRFALGDYESFRKNLLLADPPIATWILADKPGIYGTVLQRYFRNTLLLNLVDIINPGIPTAGINVTVGTPSTDYSGDPASSRAIDAETLYNWLNAYASDVYGKQFLVGFKKGTQVCRTMDIDTSEQTYYGSAGGSLEASPDIIYSDEPSTEGAWASKLTTDGELIDTTDVLGIFNPTDVTPNDDKFGERADFFKDEQGKYQAMVRYSVKSADAQLAGGEIDVKSINVEDYLAGIRFNAGDYDFYKDLVKDHNYPPTTDDDSTYIWVKADIHPEWIEGTPIINPNWPDTMKSILLKVSSPVLFKNPLLGSNMIMDILPSEGPVSGTNRLSQKPDGNQLDVRVDPAADVNLAGQAGSVNAIAPPAVFPTAAGVPMKSNVLTYGPWKMVGANPGGVQCDLDEGLTPWEYGGISYMNEAGYQKVLNNITESQWAERGEVTVPGYPTRLLGSCLTLRTEAWGKDGKNAPQTKTRDAESVFTRKAKPVTITYHESSTDKGRKQSIDTSIVVFDSLDKQQSSASISNINVSVGSNGITTSYQISTFTPVYGRFSKGNADRVKQIGLNRLKGEREMRARNQLRRMLSAGAGHLGSSGRWGFRSTVDQIGKGSIAPKSPMVLYVGKNVGWELPYPTGTGISVTGGTTETPLGYTGIPLSNAFAAAGRYQYIRKNVLGATATTLAHYKNYEGTAMMTMDGLMHPVTQRNAHTVPFFGTGVAGSWPLEGSYAWKRFNAQFMNFYYERRNWYDGDTSTTLDPSIGGYTEQQISSSLPSRAWGNNELETATDGMKTRGQAGGEFGADYVIPTPSVEDVGTGVGKIGRYPLSQKTQTIGPYPPISGYQSLEISTWYLDFLADPVSNPFLCNDIRATGILGGWWCGVMDCCDSDRFGRENCTPPYGTGSFGGAAGHDIEGVARSGFEHLVQGSSTGSLLFRPNWDPIGHGKPNAFPSNPEDSDPQNIDYATNYRYMAMRGPLMLHSWGYDVQGHPIPNEFDIRNPNACCWPPGGGCPDTASSNVPYLCFGATKGEFQTDYARVSDKFMDNWLQRSDAWPVAPVDLRFDRKRGVWTVPPSFRLLQVTTTGVIEAGGTDTATVDKWIHDMNSPDYTIGTGTGEGMEHELTGQKFSGPKGTSGPLKGKHVIQLENWSSSIIRGKVLAYYDTAEGKYWAVQKMENGVPAGYYGCSSRAGGTAEEPVGGCFEGNNVQETTILGEYVAEDGGEERVGITTLMFGCGIKAFVTPDWTTRHVDWYSDNPYEGTIQIAPGSMMVAGLNIAGAKEGQDPAPAERITFSDKFTLNVDGDTPDWHPCEWHIDLAGDLGGCQSGINAVVKYVESVVCVGASFEVCTKNMEFYSGCLVATSDQPANKINM